MKKPRTGSKKPSPNDKDKQRKLAARLVKYELFSSFSFEEISLLLFCSERMSFPGQEVIFREGDTGDNFFAILEGRVEIRRETSGKTLALLGPGEVFGEMAVLDNQPRSATALTIVPTELFAFDGHRLLDDFPNLSVKLLRYLARELSKRLREADMLIDRC